MDSIIWAIKHTMRDIADIGLSCMSNSTVSPEDLLTATTSMLGGYQQLFRGGRPSSQQRLFPAILFEYYAGHLFRPNGCGPQEWIQTAERGVGSHVPACGAEHDTDTIVRCFTAESDCVEGVLCESAQGRFSACAAVGVYRRQIVLELISM
jgi:hypothetical protein